MQIYAKEEGELKLNEPELLEELLNILKKSVEDNIIAKDSYTASFIRLAVEHNKLRELLKKAIDEILDEEKCRYYDKRRCRTCGTITEEHASGCAIPGKIITELKGSRF